MEHVFETKGYVVSQSISSIINTLGTARRMRGGGNHLYFTFLYCVPQKVALVDRKEKYNSDEDND